MRYSGVYFIPNGSLSLDASLSIVNSIISGIESNYPFATRQNPWSLSFRLARSTPVAPPKINDDENKSMSTLPLQPPNYQHFLHLSHLSTSRTYIYINTHSVQTSQNIAIKNEPGSQVATPQPSQRVTAPHSTSGTVASIPMQQTDSHYNLIVNTFGALWSHRSWMHVQNGMTYAAGQFTIHTGELRSIRTGPQSANGQSPGVVVCITTTIGIDDNDDEDELPPIKAENTALDGNPATEESLNFDEAEALIRTLWGSIHEGKDLGKSEVREVMMAKEDFRGDKEKEREAVTRMWCETLRSRAKIGRAAVGLEEKGVKFSVKEESSEDIFEPDDEK